MLKIFKYIAITILSITLLVSGFTLYIGYDIFYANMFKYELMRIPSIDNKHEFVLMEDMAGFGDNAWYVYQVKSGSPLTKDMKEAHNEESVIFWNYSEDGSHSNNPKIEIIKNEYLVFSRGGRYHSLHDICRGKVLINDTSPWNSFVAMVDENTYTEDGKTDWGKEKQLMDEWVVENLQKKIKTYIGM